MYKKLIVAFIGAIIVLSAVQSCSKDKTRVPLEFVCDSALVYTYVADVKPIFENSCASFACHSNFAQAGNLALEDYAACRNATEKGNVLCAIKHTCLPMPLYSAKLSDSLIQVIECWAAKGFVN